MHVQTIGVPAIDNVLSQLVERYEARFPGRVRAYYLAGSYVDGKAVAGSDIDLYVLFKDAFLSDDEAEQAETLVLDCAELTPLRLDLSARSEASHASLCSYTRVAIKQHSLLLYGEDTRATMSLPDHEEYRREATEMALEFLLRQRKTGTLTYPLAYPDPTGLFFGYDQPQQLVRTDPAQPGIRLMFEIASRITTALLALKTESYISTKWEGVQTYRRLVNDEWTAFIEAMFEKGKLQWNYALPEGAEERAELRGLCERMLAFENHYLLVYHAYLLELLHSDEKDARQFAEWGFAQVKYNDAEASSYNFLSF